MLMDLQRLCFFRGFKCLVQHAQAFDFSSDNSPEMANRVQLERLGSPYNIEGTGVGLVITRRLLEIMAGSIGVESEPGKGSAFWLELKLSRKI